MNRLTYFLLGSFFLATACTTTTTQPRLTDVADPMVGTTTLWEPEDLGYVPTRRAWGAEAFPGASLPNAMVQLTPVTQFRSGSGYQYEDTVIYGFAHTSKGHWNLCHIPLLPATGNIDPDDYQSGYNHSNESARPGYYQVFLERYGINAELTTTLRCAYHKYTYNNTNEGKKLIADLTRSNERVRDWAIQKESDNVFTGYQATGETMYFYAVSNHPVAGIDSVKSDNREVSVVTFSGNDANKPLELKIGFSFVSVENAKMNLEAEMINKDFAEVKNEADATWEKLLSKIQVQGGSDKQRKMFYSCLYHAFLWPVLRSDVNKDFTNIKGEKVNKGFHYYTDPSFWDDYRNKLVLLGMISPEVTADVISSISDKGEIRGFMPTFFHGDHASVFVTGTYLRGIRGYDIQKAYNLILRNATVEGRGGRRFLNEYIEKGYIAEEDIKEPKLETVAKAAVTKTQEYSYDDYAVALLAKELGDTQNYEMLMQRTGNYKNLFDRETQLMRGRLENGDWITPFDPYFPYYEYMYREANAWQSAFFAPHDTEGLIALYSSPQAFELKVDSLFSIPWKGYEAHNLTVFIGQYCHGNQPDHGFPYLYYFINKPEKSQAIIDKILNEQYGMGPEGLAYPGMDDAGEMSSWYVFNAIGLYTYSPADPEYIVTVPLFDKVTFALDDTHFTITKKGNGRKMKQITYDNQPVNGYFISHDDLKKGKELVITTE